MKVDINNNLAIHKSSYPYISQINKDSTSIGQFELKKDCFIKSPAFNGKKINKKAIRKIEEQLRNLDDIHDPYSDVVLLGKHKIKSPVFNRKKINKKAVKRIEEQLRNLDGVHDPYSDVILLGKHKFQNLQEKIKKHTNTESMIKLLSGYTQHMFPDGELKVFELLKFEAKYHPKLAKNNTFNVILQEHLPEAKIRLVNKQLDVVDYMRDFIRKNFDKNDQKIITKRLDKIETDIIDDNFRIKPTKAYLEELYKELPNRKKVKSLIKITNDFPNGATSIDAFIVKNANKSQEEIAEALVSPSIITVEHYKPQSAGGEDKGGNMIAASKRMNNLRGSMIYDDFIEMFPNIPRQTQRYINDIIRKINKGQIPDIAITLPEVKQGLYNESNGKINIDISDIHPRFVKKIDDFKTKVGKLVECFQNKQ